MEKIGDRALSDFITTREASDRAGLSDAHIIRLLQRGTVEGVRFGWAWAVYWPSLEHYMDHRPKPGPRPKKRAPAGA